MCIIVGVVLFIMCAITSDDSFAYLAIASIILFPIESAIAGITNELHAFTEALILLAEKNKQDDE